MTRTVKLSAGAPQAPTLVAQIRETIRGRIAGGIYKPGDRLPSEAMLTQEFGVSRPVVREAVAALHSDRLVEPRHGAGVFVLDPPAVPEMPYRNLDTARVSTLIEMLELRTAIEEDAAGWAALRRSPAQEEKIVEALDEFRNLSRAGAPTVEADFRFHLAIAEATNNPRFPEFLRLIGIAIIPRQAISEMEGSTDMRDYLTMLDKEHGEILAAIQDGDDGAARAAMRRHLHNSQVRYRNYMRTVRR